MAKNSMLPRLKKRIRSAWAIPVALLAVFVIAGGSVFGMYSAGWKMFASEEEEKAPEAPAAVVAQWQVSPAANVLRQALTDPPEGWDSKGNMLRSPQAPHPFSCTTEGGVAPAISYAQNFNANGGEIQVMLSAYTAGMAQEGLSDKMERADSCGTGSHAVYDVSGFEEGYQVNVFASGQNTKMGVFRYGDVVAYVIGDMSNGRVVESAREMNSLLRERMADICVNPEYGGDEETRTLVGHVDYKGLFVESFVTTDPVDLPRVPEDAEYEAVEIGTKPTEALDVEVPEYPEYPVWPDLPDAQDKPQAPDAPAEEGPDAKAWDRRADDVDGPGCGWAFTGSTAPEYNAAAADEFNTKAKDEASKALAQEAKDWQSAVLTYYESFDKYEEQVPKWNAYVNEVEEVKSAWATIAAAWETYRANKALWDERVDERDAFLERQSSAQSEYERQVQVCAEWNAGAAERESEFQQKQRQYESDLDAWERRQAEREEEANEPSPSPTPTPTGTESPSPSPSSTPTPSETEEPEPDPRPTPPERETGPDCPVDRPDILDETAPDPGPEPQEPANPRPEGER